MGNQINQCRAPTKRVSSNASRLGALVTSHGFSTASLDLKIKQKEKEEKKQYKKVMQED